MQREPERKCEGFRDRCTVIKSDGWEYDCPLLDPGR